MVMRPLFYFFTYALSFFSVDFHSEMDTFFPPNICIYNNDSNSSHWHPGEVCTLHSMGLALRHGGKKMEIIQC